MKKLLLLLLSMLMMFSLVACGEKEEDDDKEDTKVEANKDDEDDADKDDADKDDADSDDEDDADKDDKDDADKDDADKDDKDDAESKETDIEGTSGVIGTIKEEAGSDNVSKYEIEYELDGSKVDVSFEGPSGLADVAMETMGMVMFSSTDGSKAFLIMGMDLGAEMGEMTDDERQEVIDELKGYSADDWQTMMALGDEYKNLNYETTGDEVIITAEMEEDGTLGYVYGSVDLNELYMSIYIYGEDEATYDKDVVLDMMDAIVK